jgi:hypothetical protein
VSKDEDRQGTRLQQAFAGIYWIFVTVTLKSLSCGND